MKKILTGYAIVLLVLCFCIYAGAEEAKEIKTGITFSGNGRSEDFSYMQDDDFKTYYPLKEKKGWLEVQTDEPVYGVYLMQGLFYGHVGPIERMRTALMRDTIGRAMVPPLLVWTVITCLVLLLVTALLRKVPVIRRIFDHE